jgi:hypothetical protein
VAMIDETPPQTAADTEPQKRDEHWGAALLDTPPEAANANAPVGAGSPFVHYWPLGADRHRPVWAASPVVLPG